jgi:NTP pyrophosphatase (non-canonical NTP hydrolase)
MIDLNKLALEIYEGNKAKGFWDEPRTNIECLALAAGECHEAIEADRKGLYMTHPSKRLLEDSMKLNFSLVFKNHVKDTMEDEVADAIIRLLDFCGARGIDIDWHIKNKLRYNATREHKHGKKY